MLSDFTKCGFHEISLSIRGDIRNFNSVGDTTDYEVHNSLRVFSTLDECEPIMTRDTMQLIETKSFRIG